MSDKDNLAWDGLIKDGCAIILLVEKSFSDCCLLKPELVRKWLSTFVGFNKIILVRCISSDVFKIVLLDGWIFFVNGIVGKSSRVVGRKSSTFDARDEKVVYSDVISKSVWYGVVFEICLDVDVGVDVNVDDSICSKVSLKFWIPAVETKSWLVDEDFRLVTSEMLWTKVDFIDSFEDGIPKALGISSRFRFSK